MSLPKINEKSIQKPATIYFKGLPDKAVIREAFQIASPLMKAIILFSCSSGCARTETLSLTIGDYIGVLSEYLPNRTSLYNGGMSLDKVNDLQGKTKNKTDAAYFMTNPDDLKFEYIEHLPAVTINTDVEKLSIKSPQFTQWKKKMNH